MPSQAKGYVDDIHAKKLGLSTDSPVIQLLAPEEQTSTIHTEVIYDSTKELVYEMTTYGPTSSSAPSSNFIKQWLEPVQNVSELGTFHCSSFSREYSRTVWVADGRNVLYCSITPHFTAPKGRLCSYSTHPLSRCC